MSLLGFSGSRIQKTMYWKGYGVFPGGTVVKSLLPMQETGVRPLVLEDPTCHGATEPVHHNC